MSVRIPGQLHAANVEVGEHRVNIGAGIVEGYLSIRSGTSGLQVT